MKTWTLTRKVLFVSAILAGFAGIYPVSYSLCPDWKVTVVDASGAPVPGLGHDPASAGNQRAHHRVRRHGVTAAFREVDRA